MTQEWAEKLRTLCESPMPERITTQYIAQLRLGCKRLLKDHAKLMAEREEWERFVSRAQAAALGAGILDAEINRVLNERMQAMTLKTPEAYEDLQSDQTVNSKGTP